MSIRVATWNLERPGSRQRSWRKYPGQKALMADVNADIWIVTEGRRDYLPVDGYRGVYSPPEGPPRSDEECLSAVWVREGAQIERLVDPAPVGRGSVAAAVHLPGFGALVVYASVIAYSAERRHIDGTEAGKNWEVHLREVDRQVGEWAALRHRFPDTPMVVAGDFNMNLAGPHWYGTEEGRKRIDVGLRAAKLQCITAEDVTDNGKLPGQQLVDHICISEQLSVVGEIGCRAPEFEGHKMSDHPLVWADVEGS